MNQKEMVETMFENLHNTVGKKVDCLIWWNNNLIKVNGLLSNVTDYEYICVNNVKLPFIDYAKAIFYVRSENCMLYLNPTVKDGYEVKPYYYVNEYRNLFFGEGKEIEELSR